MKKFVLKEISEEPKDIKFEFFRALKTFCLILVFFVIGFFLKQNYTQMLENSRNMQFYPETTLLYIDGIDTEDLIKEFGFEKNISSASYGLFQDSHGNDKFLIVVKTPDREDTHIVTRKDYSSVTVNKYTFLSNSEEKLLEFQKKEGYRRNSFLKNKNIRKSLKTLDKARTKTIIVSDISYIGIAINPDARKTINKIIDKIIIQTFENNEEITFSGNVTFENKIADAALNFNKLIEKFAKKDIKIEKYDTENLAMIIGVKDFDLWSTTLMKIIKSFPDNQYNATISLIQSVFNFDIEEDIVKQLNGNATFYMYSDKKVLHPMLLLETKKDLAVQGKKYLNFLQLTNNSKLSEKQMNNKTFNVLSGGFYPHNLIFGSIDDSLFILGHQNIIESFLNREKEEFTQENCDIYFYSDIRKITLPLKSNKTKSFWTRYKNIEMKIFMSQGIYFSGRLVK